MGRIARRTGVAAFAIALLGLVALAFPARAATNTAHTVNCGVMLPVATVSVSLFIVTPGPPAGPPTVNQGDNCFSTQCAYTKGGLEIRVNALHLNPIELPPLVGGGFSVGTAGTPVKNTSPCPTP
jgi:hypothetical protein